MSQDSYILICSSCGSKNRVPKERLKDRPICGKCKAVLEPESLVLKCTECGAKNRILKVRLKDQPVCGKCRAPIKPIEYPNHPVEMTDLTFSEGVLSFPGPVLMEYYSPMCGHCKTLDPILSQLASKYEGRLKIGKMNVDQNPMTASKFDVMSTPTMIFFKDGKQVNTLLGAQSREAIESHLQAIL